MFSLSLSPFVVLNIMASFVSLNVVESEAFQNKRNEERWRGNFNKKTEMLGGGGVWKHGDGQTCMPPPPTLFLKLHLYFPEVTEGDTYVLFFVFQNKACFIMITSCACGEARSKRACSW